MYRTYYNCSVATNVSVDQLVVEIIPVISSTCSPICQNNIVGKIREMVEKFPQHELAILLADGQIVNVQVTLCSIIGQ